MKKEFFSFFLFLMFACACPFSAHASNEAYQTWDGVTKTVVAPVGGVYTVTNAAELAWLAAQDTDYAGCTIKLGANIDLQGNKWKPIGTAAKPFQGTFEGQGKLIRGLRIFDGTSGVGLFGHVGVDGKIQQVGISGGLIISKTKTRVGAIAGVCAGQINECWSMAEIVASGDTTGALVGELKGSGSITDCYQSGLLYNISECTGGIVGYNAGTLTRVYSSGYAANEGYAIVGKDNGGTYTDCYFDRKAYLQKSGIEGDVINAVDSTTLMFSIFKGNSKWSTATNRYPVLKVFKDTDAAKLSAAPMYPAKDDKMEHANCLTNDFTVSTNGGITWKCQKTSDEQWIKISGANVKVIRPCAPTTGILVDSKLNDETRVVFMNPLIEQVLIPGTLVGYDPNHDPTNVVALCFNSSFKIEELSQMTLAQGGWLGENGERSYKVELYSIDGNNTETLVATLLPETGESNYTNWYDSCHFKTNVDGHYVIRSYVHDNGCYTDWEENKSGIEYEIFPEFIPGKIVTKADTLCLNSPSIKVNTTGSELSIGGVDPISYQWYVNNTPIEGQTNQELTDYEITAIGIYKFTRSTQDAQCSKPVPVLDSLGVYTVDVREPLKPGTLVGYDPNHDPTNVVALCFNSVSNIKDLSQMTLAQGGWLNENSERSYKVELYSIDGNNTETLVATLLAETGESNYKNWYDSCHFKTNVDGHYVIRSYVHDDGCSPDWLENETGIEYQIFPEFTPGTIVTKTDTLFLNSPSIKVNTTGSELSNGGVAPISYQWYVNNTPIEGQTNLELADYEITAPGTYKFNRSTQDAMCYKPGSLDALGTYTVVVREPLKPGTLVGYDPNHDPTNVVALCFNSVSNIKDLSQMTLAQGGCLDENSERSYKVELYSIDGNNTETLVATLLPETGESNYKNWYDSCRFKTNVDGHYVIRSYVHDDGCSPDWLENETGIEYQIFPEFTPGTIVTKADTLLFNGTAIKVNTTGSELSNGGVAPISYQWYVNNELISGQTGAELKDYEITTPGTYKFNRSTQDAMCYKPGSLDALGTYTVVVREPLKPGTLVGYDPDHDPTNVVALCFNSTSSIKDLSNMTLAQGGCLNENSERSYKVELYSIDANNTETLVATLLPETGEANYKNWYNNYHFKTDVAGHYVIRSYVHDDGCSPNWLENETGIEYQIFPEFTPGKIITDTDTLSFDGNTIKVNTTGSELSNGGVDPISYQWYINNELISGQTGTELTDYEITAPGTYKFNRSTQDAQCYKPGSLDALGSYTVVVFNPFDPGEIITTEDTAFCSLEDAAQYTILASPATGAAPESDYSYQWYVDGNALEGAATKTQNLSLSGLSLTAGYTYVFTRKAKINSSFSTWIDSRKSKKIYIMAELQVGAIENTNGVEQECFDTNATSSTQMNIKINEKEPAVCAEGLVYRWVRRGSDNSEYIIPEATGKDLDYTFTMGDITLGVIYTYTREVNNSKPECGFKTSNGQVQVKYNQNTHGEVTTTVCLADLPYKMDFSNGQYRIFRDTSDTWLVKFDDGPCQNDTLYKITGAKTPKFTINENVIGWCQGTNTMGIGYSDDPSTPANTFKITYSPDLASIMQKNDTIGPITTNGYIEFLNVPYLSSDKDLYLTLQLGYQSGGSEGVCYSLASEPIRLHPSIGGYVYSKYDRVVFVDNNPNNGALTDSENNKLEFVEYQWFKDGKKQEGQTGQYYHEGGTILYGVFYCMLKDTQGGIHRTCDVTLPAETNSSNAPQLSAVYPVPANAGEVITIETFGEATIYSFSGECVMRVGKIEGHATVNAPYVSGIYYVQITTEEGLKEMHKLIVK